MGGGLDMNENLEYIEKELEYSFLYNNDSDSMQS